MTGITPENVGKHGVLSLGESRLAGKLLEILPDSVVLFIDGASGENYFDRADAWAFTPDAPKARLGMIVRVDDEYYVRLDESEGWYGLTDNCDHAEAEVEAAIADPVFPGVADL